MVNVIFRVGFPTKTSYALFFLVVACTSCFIRHLNILIILCECNMQFFLSPLFDSRILRRTLFSPRWVKPNLTSVERRQNYGLYVTVVTLLGKGQEDETFPGYILLFISSLVQLWFVNVVSKCLNFVTFFKSLSSVFVQRVCFIFSWRTVLSMDGPLLTFPSC